MHRRGRFRPKSPRRGFSRRSERIKPAVPTVKLFGRRTSARKILRKTRGQRHAKEYGRTLKCAQTLSEWRRMGNVALVLRQTGGPGPHAVGAAQWWAWSGAACFLLGVVGFSLTGARHARGGSIATRATRPATSSPRLGEPPKKPGQRTPRNPGPPRAGPRRARRCMRPTPRTSAWAKKTVRRACTANASRRRIV